ncbi:hypothetical protein PGTUg99_037271 [Puccinia graminis f. sp. tritici]|uniref:AGC/AKT protein kinase n=1 Tax=Puccinia graminis f. sp. tritici TaxID=56615 RepID=A0A5B0RBF2_PUCGR|nr:hypothetical protein PGTUg99_037271 [Puccinia graminis f. sp. tritici]
MTHQPPPPTVNSINSPAAAAWPEPSQQPSQQLIITLIGANQLKLPNNSVRPYAVLQFDHTESITEQAHPPSTPPSSSTTTTTTTTSSSSSSSASIPTHRTKWRPVRPTNSPSTVCQLTPTNSSPLDHPIWNHLAIFDIFKPRSSLFISIYYNQNSLPSSSTQDQPDKLLGYTIIDLATLLAQNPPIKPTSDHQNLAHDKNLILDRSIDLLDQSGIQKTGSISIKIEIKQINNLIQQQQNQQPLEKQPEAVKKISIDDFEIIKLIGEGSYGQVYRVRKKDTRRLYAMKTLEKRQILIKANKQDGAKSGEEEEEPDEAGGRTPKIKLERVLTERKILEQTRGSEFLVGLKFSFQTPDNLNLVMDLKSGGELMSYMQRFGGRFEESWVIFYTAEILSGLKFLHSMNIAYRDLKPENCLLDATGHVALCDFGLSKLDMDAGSVTKTFCGTTEYIAPEVLLESGYTRLVDFWALGVLIFEMSVGWTPFFSENRAVRYTLILESDIRTKFPKRGISEVTKQIILRLLERDPARRLGSNGIHEIEEHGFFAGLDWEALRCKRLTPPFKPRVESDASLSYASDPIYSYGGRTSNSLRGNGRVERQSDEEHEHPVSLSPNTTRTQHSRPNNHSTNYNQSYQYQQQHSRRSSVENKTTGLQLNRPNLIPNHHNNHHFVSSSPFNTHPSSASVSPNLDHLPLTQRQSLEDLHPHPSPNLNNHPLHLNKHNFFKGFTFSRDDSLIN